MRAFARERVGAERDGRARDEERDGRDEERACGRDEREDDRVEAGGRDGRDGAERAPDRDGAELRLLVLEVGGALDRVRGGGDEERVDRLGRLSRLEREVDSLLDGR